MRRIRAVRGNRIDLASIGSFAPLLVVSVAVAAIGVFAGSSSIGARSNIPQAIVLPEPGAFTTTLVPAAGYSSRPRVPHDAMTTTTPPASAPHTSSTTRPSTAEPLSGEPTAVPPAYQLTSPSLLPATTTPPPSGAAPSTPPTALPPAPATTTTTSPRTGDDGPSDDGTGTSTETVPPDYPVVNATPGATTTTVPRYPTTTDR